MGANPAPQLTGFDELPGKANYFIGNDPKKWRTDVPIYAKVKYHAVYPGVDLVYYGNRRQLEHDFIVAPGADPGLISLRLEGAKKMSLDLHGNLVLKTQNGEVRFQKPMVYQELNGARQEIAGGYKLKGKNRVGFEVATYDVTKPLVIDPTLVYSTYLGGSSDDFGQGIAVDSAGNAYVTGYTLSTNFPPTTGAFQTANAGTDNAFVTKLNAAGSGLIYSTYLGGSDRDVGQGIAVDSGGSAYVTGYTYSTNFPTTTGAFQTANAGAGSTNAFVTKLNATGSGLVYSTYLGGCCNNGDFGLGIAVDSGGSAYVTGYTYSTNFPTTTGAFQTANAGSNDAFVTKITFTELKAFVQQPINPDGTSVFNASRGVVAVRFTLTLNGAATCQLSPATISLTRTAGGTIGPVDESVYMSAADTGSNFRISGCQYVYNLAASSLGTGTYRVDISINGGVVGSGIFGLK